MLEKIAQELGFSLGKIEITPLNKFVLTFKEEKQIFTSTEVEEKWQELLSKNEKAFNGELVSIKKFKLENNTAYFSLQKGDFKSYVGTKELRPISLNTNSDFNSFCMPLSFGCNAITDDDYFIISKRKGTAINNNQYSIVPEGYIDCPDMLETNPINKSIERELFEELNVYSNHINQIDFLGNGYSLDSRQPQLGFDLYLDLDRKEIEEIFVPNDEFDQIKFVSTDFSSMKEFCKICNNFTPHNMGRIIMHFAKEKGFY